MALLLCYCCYGCCFYFSGLLMWLLEHIYLCFYLWFNNCFSLFFCFNDICSSFIIPVVFRSCRTFSVLPFQSLLSRKQNRQRSENEKIQMNLKSKNVIIIMFPVVFFSLNQHSFSGVLQLSYFIKMLLDYCKYRPDSLLCK